MSYGKVEGVIEIGRDLYVKTPEALSVLLEGLKDNYEVEDLSKDKRYPSSGRWSARVRENVVSRKGKCGSCGAYIKTAGIRMHKHKCESCGAYTYLDFKEGSVIEFYFITGSEKAYRRRIRMSIFGYDDESSCLLLQPEPLDSGSIFNPSKEESIKILEENQGRYTVLEKDDKKLISIPYDPCGLYRSFEPVINVSEIKGHEVNYTSVRLYKGKEYREWDKIPITESYSIIEAWHWAPLETSSKLHERIISAGGMVSRCDYYYQDGRIEFHKPQLEKMRLFVQHFTTLNLNDWDRMIRCADKSGPGMIRAIASFCSDNPEIEDNPNIGNALYGIEKITRGEMLTNEEVLAMNRAVKDPEQGGVLCDIFKSLKDSLVK